jgi:hypothetical protein
MKDVYKMIQTDIYYEITDTIDGEPNRSWAKCGIVQCKPGERYSDLAVSARVKKAIGWENLQCERSICRDMVVLRPYGQSVVMFIYE